jgi:hypothetical protein
VSCLEVKNDLYCISSKLQSREALGILSVDRIEAFDKGIPESGS